MFWLPSNQEISLSRDSKSRVTSSGCGQITGSSLCVAGIVCRLCSLGLVLVGARAYRNLCYSLGVSRPECPVQSSQNVIASRNCVNLCVSRVKFHESHLHCDLARSRSGLPHLSVLEYCGELCSSRLHGYSFE